MKSFPNKTAGQPRVHLLGLLVNVSLFASVCPPPVKCELFCVFLCGRKGSPEAGAGPGRTTGNKGGGGRAWCSSNSRRLFPIWCWWQVWPFPLPSCGRAGHGTLLSLPICAGEQPTRHPPGILRQLSHHGRELGWGPEHGAWLLEGRAARSSPSPAALDCSPAGK